MERGPPKLVKVAHDDYHAEYVGKTRDGRQFFLTTPFVPEVGRSSGREFIALYVFDASGQLLEATIDDLGRRSKLDLEARVVRRDALLESLGPRRTCAIQVAPFSVQRFGVEFGFIARLPEDEGEDWCVTVEPGDYMCFWPPWTSGDYDT